MPASRQYLGDCPLTATTEIYPRIVKSDFHTAAAILDCGRPRPNTLL